MVIFLWLTKLTVIYLKKSIAFHWSNPDLYFVDHNIFNLSTVFHSTNVPWTQRKSEFFENLVTLVYVYQTRAQLRDVTLPSRWIILTIFLFLLQEWESKVCWCASPAWIKSCLSIPSNAFIPHASNAKNYSTSFACGCYIQQIEFDITRISIMQRRFTNLK